MFGPTPSQQRGFTLVEIAIVLVIIGLLLGGILKGQELITSAQVRNLADQNSGVQAAYYGFIDRYRNIPGDMDAVRACQAIGATNIGAADCTAANATVGGDSNGRLNTEDYTEASALWTHLSASNFIQGSYAGGAADDAAYVAPTITPVNTFNGRIALTRSDDFAPAGSATSRLLLFIGNNIPVNVLRELDTKIDDSLPESGVLRHTAVGATAQMGVAASTATCVTAIAGAPSIWNIEGNEFDCNAVYLY